MTNYQETVEWMFQQLPMYQRVGAGAYRVDLTNINKLSAHLNHPHKNFKSVHVAGTNGKGSVSHMFASVLQQAGYKVGLYTSPHLKDFRERIKINGREIAESAVVDFISENRSFFEKESLSFFEMTVGMAFAHFSHEKVDIAVIEVGLGGRLDSTNIITPELSVITNIGYDHTAILGNTLAEIAREKAGIIKEGIPVVIGEKHVETLEVFKKISKEKNSPMVLAEEKEYSPVSSDLRGAYQKKNIRTVLAGLEVLRDKGWKLKEADIRDGIGNAKANTGLRGRWEVLRENPKVVCDTAHNKEGLGYVLQQLREEEFQDMHIVLGVVNDKDLDAILPLFPREAKFYFCKPNVPRGLDAEILEQKAQAYGLHGTSYSSVSKAYEAALGKAGQKDLIYGGGSTFTVAEII